MDRSTGTRLNTNFCNFNRIGSISATPYSPHYAFTISGSSGEQSPHPPELPEPPESHPPLSPQKSGDSAPVSIPAIIRRLINNRADPPAVSPKIAMPRRIGISNFRKLRGAYVEIAGTYPIINPLSPNGRTISDAYPDGAPHAKTPYAFCQRSCRSFENR
jgi:hypothetical protein